MTKHRSYQEIADDFEQEISELMKRFGFEHVSGGRSNKIGGHQIDASALHENHLFVIECSIRTKGPTQSLRAKIRSRALCTT
jgi:Holliday junction resolvase